jgi:hypothetical protein
MKSLERALAMTTTPVTAIGSSFGAGQFMGWERLSDDYRQNLTNATREALF